MTTSRTISPSVRYSPPIQEWLRAHSKLELRNNLHEDSFKKLDHFVIAFIL